MGRTKKYICSKCMKIIRGTIYVESLNSYSIKKDRAEDIVFRYCSVKHMDEHKRARHKIFMEVRYQEFVKSMSNKTIGSGNYGND